MNKPLLLFAFIAVLLSGCKTKPREVTVEFRFEQDGALYTLGTPFFKGDTAVALDLVHFYISELTVGDEEVEDVLFVDPSNPAFNTFELPPASGNTLSFGLGVPSDLNGMDPTTFETTHPLSSAFAMYWTWASKYRFIKAEGRYNIGGDLTNASSNEPIIWHTGTDPLYTKKSFNTDIEPGDLVVITLDLDVLLQEISLDKDSFTHTSVDTYTTAENATEAFLEGLTVEIIR